MEGFSRQKGVKKKRNFYESMDYFGLGQLPSGEGRGESGVSIRQMTSLMPTR